MIIQDGTQEIADDVIDKWGAGDEADSEKNS